VWVVLVPAHDKRPRQVPREAELAPPGGVLWRRRGVEPTVLPAVLLEEELARLSYPLVLCRHPEVCEDYKLPETAFDAK